MSKILINGLNAKSGGGKSILNNYLKILKNSKDDDKYYVLTPCKNDYLKYQSINVNIIDIPLFYKKQFLLPFTYIFVLSNLVKRLKIDSIFNLADIPIATKVYQVFLFDWPYGVYPTSVVWKKMNLKDFLFRKFKLYLFTRNLRYINHVIAQNDAMKKRLIKYFRFKKISVVNNAVSLENLSRLSDKKIDLPNGKILTYLTYYYPHKNLEIFLKLARLIKDKNLDYKIITTISADQSNGAKIFLQKIKNNRLEDIIFNIGPVQMKDVPNLYNQSDALLMPTLLESFSGTYVEAMFHKIPILTSNIDFAFSVCGDAAVYFDPLDPQDILSKIESVIGNSCEIDSLVQRGSKRLLSFYSWEEAYNEYQKIIKNDE